MSCRRTARLSVAPFATALPTTCPDATANIATRADAAQRRLFPLYPVSH